jgi:hypothetical protein
MTQKQLEDYLWGAANILRGMIDAADWLSPLITGHSIMSVTKIENKCCTFALASVDRW